MLSKDGGFFGRSIKKHDIIMRDEKRREEYKWILSLDQIQNFRWLTISINNEKLIKANQVVINHYYNSHR